MSGKFRKILALTMAVILVVTTVMFSSGNLLQAEGDDPSASTPAVSEQQSSSDSKPAPVSNEPVTDVQEINMAGQDEAASSLDEEDDEDIDDDQLMNSADRAMKAKKFRGDMSGLKVNIDVPEGAFDMETEMKLGQGDASTRAAIEKYFGGKAEVTGVQAVDISFKNDKSRHAQPRKNVSVVISSIDISGENMALFHMKGNTAEYVKEVNGKSVSYTAKDFSTYAVAAYNNIEQPGVEEEEVADEADVASLARVASPIAITGPTEVEVGGSIELTGTEDYYFSSHQWKASSSSDKVRIKANGNKATITGLEAGQVTIVHKYGWRLSNEESYIITVKEPTPIPATNAAITGPGTVNVYETINLNIDLEPSNAQVSITWESSDDRILTVNNNGRVTGVKEGTATVTAYVTNIDGTELEPVTKTITVNKAAETNTAKFFYLKTPTSNPASNSTSEWGRNIGTGKINIRNLEFDGLNAWIASDPGRVTSWPADFAGGNVPEGGQDWNTIVNAYRSTITAAGGTVDDVEAIILHPYKISNNNDGYHVDCTVEIKIKSIHTATYYLWDAGGTGYVWQAAESVRNGNTTRPTGNIANLPETKNSNGRVYRLITWHDNSDLTGNPVAFPYTVTENVNFYAKYIADYLVSYDMNGGDGYVASTAKNAGDNVRVSSFIPTREGYNFIGWKYAGTEAIYHGGESFVMPEADVRLIAQWEAKHEITLTANSGTFTYDGSEHEVSGLVSTTFEFNGQSYTVEGVSAQAARTDAGSAEVIVEGTPVVRAADGTVVTDQFIVHKTNGTLTVNKRNVSLASGSASKEYDGKVLRNEEVVVSGDGFVEGEGATYNVTGSQKYVGISDNTFTYELNAGTKASNYNITKTLGRLEVTNRDAKYEITVKANSHTTKYDGTEKKVEGLETVVFELDGEEYTVEGLSAKAEGTDAGVYPANVIGTAVVRDAAGEDVTEQFAVHTEPGSLTITKRNVTLASGSAEKEYDGTPLTNGNVAVSGDDFAAGEGATYTVTGSQSSVGSSTNAFTYNLNEGTKASNYEITTVVGLLTVINREAKYQITFTANSDEIKYDGNGHSVTGYEVASEVTTFQSLFSADKKSFKIGDAVFTVSGLSAGAEGTNAGEYISDFEGSAVIKDEHGNVVTDQFQINQIPGKLKIDKRDVRLTSGSASKEYDGDPLTNEEVTVGLDGFAEGEGATYTVTGTRTLVGISDNTFEYALNAGTLAANYNITKTLGRLEVTNREAKYEIQVEANSGSHKYTGETKTVEGLVTDTFTVNGKTYTVEGLSARGEGTDAGEYPVNVTGTAVVRDAAGADVTEQFAVKTLPGKLEITKREVVLTSATDSKQYDGDPLTNNEITVGGEGFAGEEGFVATVTGLQLTVGSSENTFTYTLTNGAKEGNYNIRTVYGELTVTDREAKYEITVEANSGSYLYDGTVKNVNGLKTTEFEVNGNRYQVSGLSARAVGQDAGEYLVSVEGEAVVRDAAGNDVTSQFTVHKKAGKLEITPRAVTLSSLGASKEYDGTPLTNEEVTVGGDGFAAGEGATYNVTGSQTYVGESKNTFTYELKANTKAGNYQITKEEGKLIVSDRSVKYRISLVPNSNNVTYDGNEHAVNGFETTRFEVDGHIYTVEGISAGVTGTEAGEYPVVVEGTPVVKAADGTVVTDQFDVTIGTGKLVINKANAKVVIAGNIDAAQYDGEEHAVEGYKVTSIVSNDNLYTEDDFTFTGTAKASRTDEGKSYMNLTPAQFTNVNNNFNVEFEVTDGYIIISKAEEVVVIITGHNDEMLYDGSYHSLAGYDVTISNPLFKESDIIVSDRAKNAEVNKINAGEYPLGLTEADFSTNNNNFEKVTFIVTDGSLKINIREITVTSASATKYYDGKVLRKDEVYVSGDGLAPTDELSVVFGPGIKNVGVADNQFECAIVRYSDIDDYLNNNETLMYIEDVQQNYDITKVYGILRVLEQVPGVVPGQGGDDNPNLVVTDGYNITEIGGSETPLANTLLDVHCCILHMLIMAVAMLMLLWYMHDMKKRQKKIFELEGILSEEE